MTGDDERAKAEAADDAALARTVASGDIPRTHRPTPATDVRGHDPALAATMTPEVASEHEERRATTLTAEHPGRYVRQDELGRGGMGRVVVVKDTHLGREVALKELLDQSIPGNDAMSIGSAARFLREARITGQLEHPGIVPVHELGQRADGTIYYTMKRIRGRSLASVLKEKTTLLGRLTLLSVFRHVCEAVAYAHSLGVVHRDLKPDNVMVGEFGDTLVVDWGLAKVRGEAEITRDVVSGSSGRKSTPDDLARTLDGHAIGTPAYMSPEQARGELSSIDERADVWGLGAILFEILVGRAPYAGTSALDVLAKVLDEPPPHVREVAPDAPAELAAVVDRALMRDASSRYPNAGELAKEIGAYLDGRQVGAYEYSSYELIFRFVRRHRAASFAAISIALAVITASIVVYRSFLDESRARALAETARDDATNQRSIAEDSMHAAEDAVADALLERAERALAEGDASGAAVFAAGVLVRDANASSATDPERYARALTLYIEADARRRYTFEQTVEGAHARSALSTDGRTIAVPTESAVRVISLDDRSERRLELHATRVRALGATGLAVIEGDAPGVYDLGSGERVHETPSPTSASIRNDAIAIASADGDVLVLSGDGRRELDHWSTPLRGQVRAALSMAGDRLALLSMDLPEVTIETLPRGDAAHIPLHALPYLSAFAPRGDRLAVLASDFVATLSVAATDPAASMVELPTRTWPTAMAWAGDAAIALYEDGDHVTLRDPSDGRVIDQVHLPATTGGRLDTGGPRLVFLPSPGTGGLDDASVFLRVDVVGRDAIPLEAAIRDLALDLPRHRVLAATLTSVWSVAIVPNGHLGAATEVLPIPVGLGVIERLRVLADGTIVVLTMHGGLLVAEGPSYASPLTHQHDVDYAATLGLTGLAVSPQTGDVFYGLPGDGSVQVWSRREHVERQLVAPTGTVSIAALAVSPDGAWLAVGEHDGSVRIVSTATGASEHVVPCTESSVSALGFSPSGDRIAVADETGHVEVIGAHDGARFLVARPQQRCVNGISWSPDGRWIVTTSDGRRVDVLSSADLQPLRIVRTTATPTSAFLTADSSHLVFHDGRSLVQLDLRMAMDEPTPAVLLDQAERRAGVHLDGLMLGPRAP